MEKEPKYKYIRAWGMFMHSEAYWINAQVQKAIEDNAPEDAIYQHAGGGWMRFSELQQGTKNSMRASLEMFGIEI